MSFELHWLVAAAMSSFSTSVTLRPRPAASRAMPQPLMPPPMMRMSVSVKRLPRGAKLSPPQQRDAGLGIGNVSLADPLERVGHLGLEYLQVLAGIEVGAHMGEVARAEQVDH